MLDKRTLANYNFFDKISRSYLIFERRNSEITWNTYHQRKILFFDQVQHSFPT